MGSHDAKAKDTSNFHHNRVTRVKFNETTQVIAKSLKSLTTVEKIRVALGSYLQLSIFLLSIGKSLGRTKGMLGVNVA